MSKNGVLEYLEEASGDRKNEIEDERKQDVEGRIQIVNRRGKGAT